MEDFDGRNWVVIFFFLWIFTTLPHPHEKAESTTIFFSCLFTPGKGKTTSLIKFCGNHILNLHQKVCAAKKKYTVLQDWIHCSLFFTLWMSKWNSLGLSQPCSGQSVRVWLTACGTINCPAAQQDCQGGGARAEDEEESRAVANAKQKEQAQHRLSGNSPNVALLINLTPSARPGLLFQTFRCVKITLS